MVTLNSVVDQPSNHSPILSVFFHKDHHGLDLWTTIERAIPYYTESPI